MKSKKVKSGKVDKNIRNVKISCIECGKALNFSIENDVVIQGSGMIAMNYPGAVCQDCINVVLDRVADPPGLICVNELSPILAVEIIGSFEFLLPPSHAVDFFISLFPENDLIYAACERRLRGESR